MQSSLAPWEASASQGQHVSSIHRNLKGLQTIVLCIVGNTIHCSRGSEDVIGHFLALNCIIHLPFSLLSRDSECLTAGTTHAILKLGYFRTRDTDHVSRKSSSCSYCFFHYLAYTFFRTVSINFVKKLILNYFSKLFDFLFFFGILE